MALIKIQLKATPAGTLTTIATADFFQAIANGNVSADGTIVIKGVQYDLLGALYVPAGTTALTTITHTAPGTADYAIQGITSTTPFGFVSADEGNSVLSVIKNLQLRVAELETGVQV